MVKQFNNHQFRMHYQTVELAAYHINVFSDIATQVDYDAHIIHITPLANYEPVQTSASMNATTAPGTFSMRSVFEAMGGQTRVEYQLEIHSNLPRPTGLRLMPRTVVNKITQNITQKRMREIAEGFIENSIEGFLAQEEASEEEFWDEAF
ncbi:MAG TPA: hypothetical protein VLL52_04085 [Anaerolineae bacterium]|nr:hypothetical protein [Anaerolineae bacterium]